MLSFKFLAGILYIFLSICEKKFNTKILIEREREREREREKKKLYPEDKPCF